MPFCVSGYDRIYAMGLHYICESIHSTIEVFDGIEWSTFPFKLPSHFCVYAATLTYTKLIVIGVCRHTYTAYMIDTITCMNEILPIPPRFGSKSVLITLNEAVYCIHKRTHINNSITYILTNNAWIPYEAYNIRESIIFGWPQHNIDVIE